MKLFDTTSINLLITSSLAFNPDASAFALLTSQDAYGFSDPLQNVNQTSCNVRTKAGLYNADFCMAQMPYLRYLRSSYSYLRSEAERDG